MRKEFVKEFAKAWIDAWNSNNLAEILNHSSLYALIKKENDRNITAHIKAFNLQPTYKIP